MTQWKQIADQQFLLCDVKAFTEDDYHLVVRGELKNALKKLRCPIYLKYWASNPVMRTYSPVSPMIEFPNEAIAFDNSCNQGIIPIRAGYFNFHLKKPNRYYSEMGLRLNPSQVNLQFCDSEKKNITRVYQVRLCYSNNRNGNRNS